MAEQTGKCGSRLDDQVEHETSGMVRGDGRTRVDEGHETEPLETDTGRDPTISGTARGDGMPPA